MTNEATTRKIKKSSVQNFFFEKSRKLVNKNETGMAVITMISDETPGIKIIENERIKKKKSTL